VERIHWLHGRQKNAENLPCSPYASIDPAPPSLEQDVDSLKQTLINTEASLFARYRAMFALRNQSSLEAAIALAEGDFILTAVTYKAVFVFFFSLDSFYQSYLSCSSVGLTLG